MVFLLYKIRKRYNVLATFKFPKSQFFKNSFLLKNLMRLSMTIKSKISVGAILCLLALCVVAGNLATTFAVDLALKREARSLGMDWALHIENQISDLDSMRGDDGRVDPTKLPDPEAFRRLLTDVTSVGHIYQFDFINSRCLCELSIGSHVPGSESTTPPIDDHSGHDHAKLVGPDLRAGRVAPEVLSHVLGNTGSHAEQKLPLNSGLQLSVDRGLVRQIIDDGGSPIIIRRNVGLDQPNIFAEVYHPAASDGELLYLLRVLVDLEDQARNYTVFFRLGALLGLVLLALAFGYPAFLYFRSLSKQREADRRVHFLAHHDVLTNLKNRNDFHESVSDILWRCSEKKNSALLFIFDLNSFKEVNDVHGHHVGDKLLCEIASVLRKHIPEGGYIARLGGDEFVVVLGGISDDDIDHHDFLDMPPSVQICVPGSGEIVKVTIAGGVAQYPRDAETISDLLQAADLALYDAKPNRAGEIREYDIEMKRAFFDRVQIRDQFRLGLEKSQIEPYYQPIVNMKTGKVEALEALARWNHPERGMLTPFIFGTIFDDDELSVLLGQQMLTKTLADMKEWKEAGVAFKRIGLNVLDSDLMQDGFAENIFALLDKNGLTSSDLAIEVTENCLFGENKAYLISVLESLHHAGHSIALDDFGTGYSSITQLKELPISNVKIDKSFIDNVTNNHADQSIISALLNLSISMDFQLILEGIETADQRDFLKNMGFILAQGYYYSHPLPASQVPAFIRRQESGYDGAALAAKAG
jgi:diguanylate cyclase (GGDEF)-like protein